MTLIFNVIELVSVEGGGRGEGGGGRGSVGDKGNYAKKGCTAILRDIFSLC